MRSRCLTLVLSTLLAVTATVGRCGSITAAMRRDDPRLAQPVTVAASRIYVGELLERLSAQTGVALAASNRDGAADQQVSAFLVSVPLADAMDALWSLLSYQRAEWLWTRSKNGKPFRYWLERPPAAQHFASWATEQIQASLDDQAKALLGALSLTPEGLREAAKKDSRLSYLLESPRGRAGLAVLAEALSPARQRTVLHGEERVRVPVSQLSPQGRAFVHSVWAAGHWMRSEDNGPWEPTPEPTWIEFALRRPPDQVAPVLFIYMEGIGGYGYLGGMPLERAARQRMSDLWMLPGDRTDSEPGAQKEPALPAQAALAAPIAGLLARYSRGLARAVPLVLPPGPADNRAIRAFLENVAKHTPGLQRKWRGQILLLAHPGWFNEEADGSTVPWAVVKDLRKREESGGGLLSLRDLAAAADSLTAPQLMRLAEEEFPMMAHVARFRSLFVLLNRSSSLAAALLSPSGVPLSALPREIPASLGLQPTAHDEPTAIRLVQQDAPPAPSGAVKREQDVPDRNAHPRTILIETLGASGGVLARQGFSYQGRNR